MGHWSDDKEPESLSVLRLHGMLLRSLLHIFKVGIFQLQNQDLEEKTH